MCHCLSGWINPGIIALFSSIAWGSFTWKQSKTWPPPIKTWSSQYAYWLNPCFCSLMMPFYVSVYLHFCWFGSPFCWICSLLLKIVSSCDLVLFRIMSAFDQQTQVYWIRGERLPQEKGDVLLKPSHTQLNNQFKKKTDLTLYYYPIHFQSVCYIIYQWFHVKLRVSQIMSHECPSTVLCSLTLNCFSSFFSIRYLYEIWFIIINYVYHLFCIFISHYNL